MSHREPVGLAMLEAAVRWAMLIAVLMLAVSVYALAIGSPAAADGHQGSPVLQPERVEAPTDPFSLVPPAGARCEEEGSGRSGADGWRWHTFIVEAGRDLSTLEFGPHGPGNDYDATDGQITATLIAAGRGVWSEAPAVQPKGLINPNGLGGLVLDPADYTLRDGSYLIGFACTDEASATRQWWSLEVSVQVSAAPFLTVEPAPGPDAGGVTQTDASSTTIAGAVDADPATASTVVAAAEAGNATGGSSEVTGSADEEPAPAITGISWSPLVALVDASSVLPAGAWAGVVLVLARIAYLLARPVRVLPPLAP